jgi:SAM-dependent methyltransferase
MRVKVVAHKLNRAVAIYRDEGFRAVALRLLHRIWRFAGGDDPKHAEWLKRKMADDAEFDAAHGTHTGGIQELFGFKIVGENAGHGLSHIASGSNEFSKMMAELDIEYKAFTFIDLGSGKGRALMLAAAFPFRRIVGVEFAAELHEVANANIAALAVRQPAMPQVELICGDAAAYEFPNEPLIIYLFNPFGSAVIRSVAERAINSWRNANRPVHILYMNPVHVSDFVAAGWKLHNKVGVYAHLLPTTD